MYGMGAGPGAPGMTRNVAAGGWPSQQGAGKGAPGGGPMSQMSQQLGAMQQQRPGAQYGQAAQGMAGQLINQQAISQHGEQNVRDYYNALMQQQRPTVGGLAQGMQAAQGGLAQGMQQQRPTVEQYGQAAQGAAGKQLGAMQQQRPGAQFAQGMQAAQDRAVGGMQQQRPGAQFAQGMQAAQGGLAQQLGGMRQGVPGQHNQIGQTLGPMVAQLLMSRGLGRF